MNRSCLAVAGLILVALTTLRAPAATPKRVLMVFREPGYLPGNVMIEQAVRNELRDPESDGIEIYTEQLYAGGSRDFLREKYGARPPDVILTTAMAVSEVASGDLIPGVPTVFIWVNPDPFPVNAPGTNITGVIAMVDFNGTLDLIFRLQPDTRRVVVISGVAPSDRRRLALVEQTSQSFSNRAAFEFWTNQPITELQKAVGKLPAGNVILYTWMFRDVSGRPFIPVQALDLLLEKASVPVYVFVESQLGSGAVGGAMVPYDEVGRQAGEIAQSILNGAKAADIPITVVTNSTPKFDRRALRRWGIGEGLLPPGSIVESRQRSFWDQYRWRIVGVLVFCGLQTALIIGLLVNRAQRRRGEAAAALIASISSHFVNLPVGEVDREIENALRQVCEVLRIDLAVLWQWSVGTPGVALPTHAYCTQQDLRPLEPVSQEHYPWTMQQVQAGRMFALSSLEQYPAEAAMDRENCRRSGIKAAVCLPLLVGGDPPLGALCLSALRAERGWPESLVSRLQVVAQILANALARKRADQALQQAQHDLAQLLRQNELVLNSAAEGILGLDLQGNHSFVNPAAAKMLGYEPKELLGRHSHNLWHHTRADGRPYPEHECKIYASFADGKPQRESTEVFWRKDGTSFPVDYASTPVYEEGRLLGAVVTFQDITERRRTEDQVRQLSFAIEQSPVSVVITDLQGKMIYVNRKFSEISGYSLAECVGQTPRILKSGESLPSTYEQLWKCITSGNTWRGEFHNRKKNGDLYWEWAVISPLFDAAGKATHFVGVKEDITERKRAAMETQELRGHLAHVARVSTMGELAASVAHELNQPLGAILANAEAAELFLEQDPPAVDDLRAILADIRRDDERAGEVIRRMRTLLRRRELEMLPLDINALAEDVLQLVSGDAAMRGVSLTADLSPVLPRVAGDRVHLQQVLLNLILNGMDALDGQPRDRRRVQVRTHLASDRQVRVEVMDGGHGIAADRFDKLFEPFYTTKPNGMGMGLPVSKTIIEAHKGKLWAENRPEGGACFCFTLPLRDGNGGGASGTSIRPDSGTVSSKIGLANHLANG